MDPRLSSIIVTLAIAVPILIMRNSRPRPLKIERLWVRPAIFIGLMGAALAATAPPLDLPDVAILVAALAIGCGMGWLRGRSMRIEVHPETGDLTARASPLGLVFILGLIVVRYGLRGAAAETAPVLHLSYLAVADALVLMAVGMMVVQGLEMWLRARRLLAEAQAVGAGPRPDAPPPMPNIIS
jgi:hypothetical protein